MKSSSKKQSLSSDESCVYEFELIKGETLNGLVLSSNQIDVYLIDNNNFFAWSMDENFDHVYFNGCDSKAKIKFLAQKEGTWYLIIENNGKQKLDINIKLDIAS